MKKYSKLPIPEDSAWDKKTWRYYAPIWLNSFIDSLKNLISWIPVIWQDKHWDDYYITKIIQRKIELQRDYLVKHNRHTSIPNDNYWMTVLLNLLELEHESFYTLEKYDYCQMSSTISEPDELGKRFWSTKLTEDNLDEYLKKYPSTVRKVKKLNPDKGLDKDKDRLSMYVGMYNEKKCRNLIFEILKQKSELWWD